MAVLLDEKGESICDLEFNVHFDKDRQINQMIEMLDANDIDRLRETVICTSDGLLDNLVRTRAWPVFIGQDQIQDAFLKCVESNRINDDYHKDKDQVLKDVERSFIYLNENSVQNTDIESLRIRLNKIILRVLNTIPGINYYQGYHDVASIVILIFDDDDEAFNFLYVLTLRYLRDHMMTSIQPTMIQLDIIPELLSHFDYEFYLLIKQIKPVYALSSIISLFTHDITNFDDIKLIWDILFAHDDPQLILYIFIALLLYYKDDIFTYLNEMSDSSIDSVGTRYDINIIHVVLNNFIRTHLSVNSLDSKLEVINVLKLASNLKKKVPLTKLKNYKNISKFSFLKCKSTSITILSLQIKEHKNIESKLEKKEYMLNKINNNKGLIKRGFYKLPMIFKTSIGICIIGMVLQATYRNTGIKIGITNEMNRNINLMWNFIKENLK